ncbi:MAG: single-stranded DNA-binding protein [Anaerolineales bacterium]
MFHQVTIIGNLGRDPELRYTPSGQAVTSLSVASNRQYTASNGEKVKETIWWKVSVWGKQAEVVNQYLRRGSKVLVIGRMNPDPATGSPRIWTRQDGTAGASFEVTAEQVRFLSSRGEDEMSAGVESGPTTGGDEDIPF